MPSLYESFGMVALEAMACATPVIASRVGGLTFTVRDGETGYLVPEKDPKALAEKLELVLTDRALRERLGNRAVRVARTYGWENVADEIEDLYAGSACCRARTGLRLRAWRYSGPEGTQAVGPRPRRRTPRPPGPAAGERRIDAVVGAHVAHHLAAKAGLEAPTPPRSCASASSSASASGMPHRSCSGSPASAPSASPPTAGGGWASARGARSTRPRTCTRPGR